MDPFDNGTVRGECDIFEGKVSSILSRDNSENGLLAVSVSHAIGAFVCPSESSK